MTKEEALELLRTAPTGDKKSKINPGLTQTQVVDIVTKGIASERTRDPIDSLSEKRVWQVVKNQRRPKY